MMHDINLRDLHTLKDWLKKHPHYKQYTEITVLKQQTDNEYFPNEAAYYDEPAYTVKFTHTGVHSHWLLECKHNPASILNVYVPHP